MAVSGLPDGVYAPLDRFLLQRGGRLVAGVPGPGAPAGLHPHAAGGLERLVRAVHLQDVGSAGLPPGLPGCHPHDCRPRRQIGHREVQQNLPAGPVRAGGADCDLFPHPPGGAEGRRLPVQARFFETDASILPGRPGTVVFLAVAGHGHRHHLFLLCEQEGKPDGLRGGNGRLRPAVRHPGGRRHHAGRVRRRHRTGQRPRPDLRHASVHLRPDGPEDARAQLHRRHPFLRDHPVRGPYLVHLPDRGGCGLSDGGTGLQARVGLRVPVLHHRHPRRPVQPVLRPARGREGLRHGLIRPVRHPRIQCLPHGRRPSGGDFRGLEDAQG